MSDSPPNKLNYHKSILSVLARLRTYSRIKKHLKQLGCTKSEQREIIRALKEECEIRWQDLKLYYIVGMKQETFEHRLKMFAQSVLRTLETEKEWSADTMERISYAAMDLRLADTAEDGSFRALSVDKE